ncbi:uncharacterized protein LOC111246241 isoform X1 [Varroa destructor]|uniref:C2H2-type domain-containing protein n=1 Tax=Varroa destructor TaxID=109461 RepID=A0A7M7JG57_VARDE|nr:uncharacterized protein LOC111246241 isoform X1 [Varroa destructor]XP_022651256.1 uncharacterized protein LOC111246241 isoform X1 [Varroa destructor]XP_022651257.1 uncharacterized protein LOC111246241 isoform X1 [Varroa destructor]
MKPTCCTVLDEVEGPNETKKIKSQPTNDSNNACIISTTTTNMAKSVVMNKPIRRGMVQCFVCGDTFTKSFLLRKHRAEQCGIQCLHCSTVVLEPKMEQHLWVSHGLPAGLKRTGDPSTGHVTKAFIIRDKTPKRQEIRLHRLSGVVTEGYTCTGRRIFEESNVSHTAKDNHFQQKPIKILTSARVEPLCASVEKATDFQTVLSQSFPFQGQVDVNEVEKAASDSVSIHLFSECESNTTLFLEPNRDAPKSLAAAKITSTGAAVTLPGRHPLKKQPPCEPEAEDELGYATMVSASEQTSTVDPSKRKFITERKKRMGCAQHLKSREESQYHLLTHPVETTFGGQAQRRHEKLPVRTNRMRSNSNNRSLEKLRRSVTASNIVHSIVNCACGALYKTSRNLDKHMERCPWVIKGDKKSIDKRTFTSLTENCTSRSLTTSSEAEKQANIFVIRTAGTSSGTELDVGNSARSSVTFSEAVDLMTLSGKTLKCETCKLVFKKPETAERHRAVVHTLRPKMFRHSAAMFGGAQRRNVILTGLRGAPPPKQTKSLECHFCPKTFRTKQTLLTHCAKYHVQSVLGVV